MKKSIVAFKRFGVALGLIVCGALMMLLATLLYRNYHSRQIGLPWQSVKAGHVFEKAIEIYETYNGPAEDLKITVSRYHKGNEWYITISSPGLQSMDVTFVGDEKPRVSPVH